MVINVGEKKSTNMSNITDKIFATYGRSSEKIVKILDFPFITCNNNCDFCFQKDVEFKSISTHIPNCSDFSDSYIDKHLLLISNLLDRFNGSKIKLTFMGGELFMDSSAEKVNGFMLKLIPIIKDKDINVQIVSNLLHNNTDIIKDILIEYSKNGIKTSFNTSFDFGNVRFHDKDAIDKFENNIEIIRKLECCTRCCGVILTKYMLSSLKSRDRQNDIFEKLYDSFIIDFARLSGNFSYKLSYEEMVELLGLVCERFPNLIENNIYSQSRLPRNCLNNKHMIIVGDKVIDSCISQIYSTKNEKTDSIIDITKRYNCIGCKHFGYCIPTCPLDEHYNICELKPVIDKYIRKV